MSRQPNSGWYKSQAEQQAKRERYLREFHEDAKANWSNPNLRRPQQPPGLDWPRGEGLDNPDVPPGSEKPPPVQDDQR